MAKYKYYSYDQQLMIPVTLANQILPDTFEYTLNHLIDNLELKNFDNIMSSVPERDNPEWDAIN